MSCRPDGRSVQDYSIRLIENSDGDPGTRSNPAFSQLSTHATCLIEIDDLLLPRLAREEAEERARRLKFFDNGLLGEPAWDILLDLYVNEFTGIRASVGDACIAAGGSETTALRVIRALEVKGLLNRTPDMGDRRRQWVTVSHHGFDIMRRYLKERAIARIERPFSCKEPFHRSK